MNAFFNAIDNNPMETIFVAIVFLGFIWMNSIATQEAVTDDDDDNF